MKNPRRPLTRIAVCKSLLVASAFIALAPSLRAGPPFLTDDPEPTETGHWEIYAPQLEVVSFGKEFEGAAGIEINYGAAPDVQLTLGLPVPFARESRRWRSGRGDLEASIKYRFYENEAAGFQAAIFPGLTLPTGSHGFGGENVTAFLPVWLQKDFGQWSIFGGGGYAIHPGTGNRNFWTGGIAVTRHFGDRLTLGLEADRQGADTRGGSSSTSFGAASSTPCKNPFASSPPAAPPSKTAAAAPVTTTSSRSASISRRKPWKPNCQPITPSKSPSSPSASGSSKSSPPPSARPQETHSP